MHSRDSRSQEQAVETTFAIGVGVVMLVVVVVAAWLVHAAGMSAVRPGPTIIVGTVVGVMTVIVVLVGSRRRGL